MENEREKPGKARRDVQGRNRRTGTLPDMGDSKQSARMRQTGTLPSTEDSGLGVRNRQTGTLPDLDMRDSEQETKKRQTGTLPDMGRFDLERQDRQTDTLPDMNQQQKSADKQRPKRNIIGDGHEYTIPKGAVLDGNKEKLTVDRGIWNSQYVEMYLVQSKGSSYIAKVYYEWTPENKYQDDIIKFLENNQQPGIIPLIDRGMYGKRDYYVFPYYERKSLDEYKPEWDNDRLTKFIKVLNEALHSIHSAGFLHADIKPANILYDEKLDIPVITDFGSMTALKQDAEMKVQRSITNADGKVSEGYLAPYALAYGAAKGERVLDLGMKTDYFALGVSLCEMYVRKPYYKMFRSNAEIASSLNADSVPYHREVEENGRLYNLVQALLSNSPDLCPGYQQINDWLDGNTLEVVHKVENRAEFSHYFKQKTYTDPKELAEAYVGENWKDCINDLFRKETLYDTYRKYDEGVYSEIIDIREDNESEETKAASAFRIVCWIYPGIRFFWDGKYYNQEDETEANRELAMDIYKSVEAGDGRFDRLFSTGALKTYFEIDKERKRFLPDIERILEISEYAMGRAQLIFAETVFPGVLTGVLTQNQIHEFEDYLKAVNESLQHGGFDQAVEYNLGNTHDKNELTLLQEKAYGNEVINALLCCSGHEEEMIRQEEKTDKVFQPLVRILLMMGKILGYENVLPCIHNSAAYQAISKYVQISDQFDYIDREPDRKCDSKLIGDEFQGHREAFAKTGQSPSVEMGSYLSLLDDVLETIKKIGDDKDDKPPVIYEGNLRESGLLIARQSFILPHGKDGVICRVNGRYLLPYAVAMHLSEKGFGVKTNNLEERKELLQDCLTMTKEMISSFFHDFKAATGTENVTGEYLQARRKYILYILLPMIAGLSCVGLIGKAYLLWQWSITFAISAIVALIGILISLYRFIGAKNNYESYRRNKNLMDHYVCLKDTFREVEQFSNAGKIGKLSEEARKEVQDIVGLPSMNAYLSKYGIKQEYVQIRVSKAYPSILLILLCTAVTAYISQPIAGLISGLVTYNFSEAQKASSINVKNDALRKWNKEYSVKILKQMEDKNVSWLVGQYNAEQLTEKEYSSQVKQYMKIFTLNHVKMLKKNKKVLKGMVVSKRAFQRGVEYEYDQKKLKKAIVQYLKVIEADKNYDTAREKIDSYFQKMYKKLQIYVRKEDEASISRITQVMKYFLTQGVKYERLQDYYDCLTKYQGQERFLHIMARILKDDVIDEKRDVDPGWGRWEYVVKIGCIKENNGCYIVQKEMSSSSLYNSYTYDRYSIAETKHYIGDSINKEYSIDMVEYHNDWTEDDFYNFLLKHAEEQ